MLRCRRHALDQRGCGSQNQQDKNDVNLDIRDKLTHGTLISCIRRFSPLPDLRHQYDAIDSTDDKHDCYEHQLYGQYMSIGTVKQVTKAARRSS
jgi:hypothetical protein